MAKIHEPAQILHLPPKAKSCHPARLGIRAGDAFRMPILMGKIK